MSDNNWPRRLPVIESFLTLFDEQEVCDVKFSIDFTNVGAHKAFLRARSRVLYELAKDWTPEEKPVVINEIDFDIFKAVLRYCYSDKVEVTNENVFLFLFAAKSFEMDHLEAHCARHIVKYLGKENVCGYMEQALVFNAPALKEECHKVFTQNTQEILASQAFLNLSHQAISTFLDAEEINVLEIDLFNTIKKWMVQQCKNEELPENGANMREVIGDALYKIRFPTMTVRDFCDEVTCFEGLLTDTEIAQTFRKISAFRNGDIQCPFPSKFRCVNGVSQDANFAAQCDNNENVAIFQNGSWVNLTNAFSNWQVLNFSLDMKSVQLLLQFSADFRNSSSSRSGLAEKLDAQSRAQCNGAFQQWCSARVSSSKNMEAAMSKLAALRESLANNGAY